MSITVEGGSPRLVTLPIKDSATIYVGGLVSLDNDALDTEGIEMLPQAVGTSNTTNLDIPLGVCVGTNLRTQVENTTGKCNYITDLADAHDGSAGDYFTQGIWAKGDEIARARVAVINSNTVLKASLYNGAVGTAPTLLTATAGSGTGVTMTSNATQFTPVAGLASIYCRSGANAGAYRITGDTSTTVAAWDKPVRSDTAVGDTFVRVPLREFGVSYIQIGGTYANYIDVSASPATNYFVINVLELNLAEAGNEYVIFTFDGDNFCQARA